MKRKIGLALAVILVGVFVVVYAQAKGEKVEPASTPVSSSISASSAPVATEEPAASTEPTAGDGVEDEPVEQVTEEGPTNEGATYESDAEQQTSYSAEKERLTQKLMDLGMTREEAEQAMSESAERGQQAQDQQNQTIQERQEEEAARMEQEKQQADKEYDEFCMEHYGTTGDHWDSMTFEEKGAWMESHPMN
ncbi:hypothetical protein [Gemmiger sp. An194]|uniref:hypothetical protein n=1 Tax=Gemmiger sp. An194 TaxID=1965582 RepID=UPI000B395C97|nr:hypothetical protein [Gemmiger sp. An194]OUP21758.1 hypothetical protein B5F28_14045 [Gemmiger sp. An194]